MDQVGKYKVLGKLGQGGMGAVYRVADPDVPGRELALKHITLGPLAGELSLERFQREAQVLARVQHPNVVNVYACEPIPGGAYLVQELIDGESLKAALRGRRFEPREAAWLTRALAGAITHVHRQGVLHRDLKPSNVMLRGEEPVLLDFGIARDLTAETLTRTGATVGTPTYMSPEQANGEPVDERCDVYGLGVVLYEVLRGRPPFEGSPLSVIKQVLMNEPTWPSAERDDIPPELEAVVRKAMAKSPADRYPSAEALAEDLTRFLAGERPTAEARRGRGAIVGLVVAALVVVAGAVTLSTVADSAPAATPTPAPSRVVRDRPPVAQPAGLWSPAGIGEGFLVDLTFDERSGSAQVRMDAELWCAPLPSDLAEVRLELTPRRVRSRFRLMTKGRDDPALDDPAHEDEELSGILKEAITAPLQVRLDRETGELIALDGCDAFQAGLLDHEDTIAAFNERVELMAEGSSNDGRTEPVRFYTSTALQLIFSAKYLAPALGSLTHVQAEPWRRSRGGSFFIHPAADQRQLLPYVLSGGREKQRAPVQLEGNASYQGGRLQSAWIEQETEIENSWLRWSWTVAEPSRGE